MFTPNLKNRPIPASQIFLDFWPKTQTHKILNKSQTFAYLPSLHWWNVWNRSDDPGQNNLTWKPGHFMTRNPGHFRWPGIRAKTICPRIWVISIVRSVSFGTIKSAEIFWPQFLIFFFTSFCLSIRHFRCFRYKTNGD